MKTNKACKRIRVLILAVLATFFQAASCLAGALDQMEQNRMPQRGGGRAVYREGDPSPFLQARELELRRQKEAEAAAAAAALENLALAGQGNAEAQHNLGGCYLEGNGVVKNSMEAAKWFRKAAEQGYKPAQIALSRCYARGVGVEKNLAEAVNWNRKAAGAAAEANRPPAVLANKPDIILRQPGFQLRSAMTAIPQTPQGGDSTVVDMIEAGGVLKVPVQLNGAVTLKFVVDSGASSVQIPRDVFLTLKRAETINEGDYLPGKTFVLADGSRVQSDRFILRSVKVGDITLTNVEASVGALDAPLLLGQSFLKRFSDWKIDNKAAKLILTK